MPDAPRGPYWPLPDDTLFFYSHGRGEPEFIGLSNHAESEFYAPHPLLEGNPLVAFKSNEHHFIAHKTLVLEDFEWIRGAPSAMVAKRRGSPRGERQPDGTYRRIVLRDRWSDYHRYRVMLDGLRLKFALDEFAALLERTEDRHLAENSPRDWEWGCRDARGGYTGLNLLGRAIMRVRSEQHGVWATGRAL